MIKITSRSDCAAVFGPRRARGDILSKVEVSLESHEVGADGELLTCRPAGVLPMAQRNLRF